MDIALTFHGPIQPNATVRLRNALCTAANGGFTNNTRPGTLYLLFSSSGGSLEDGISLYSLMRNLPVHLVTVNMSLVSSIAIMPFLAGTDRYATEGSYFHFHNFVWNYPNAVGLTRMEFDDHSGLIDAARDTVFEALQRHTTLTAKDFDTFKFLDKPRIEGAGSAQKLGIVQNVGFPTISSGTPFLNVDY